MGRRGKRKSLLCGQTAGFLGLVRLLPICLPFVTGKGTETGNGRDKGIGVWRLVPQRIVFGCWSEPETDVEKGNSITHSLCFGSAATVPLDRTAHEETSVAPLDRTAHEETPVEYEDSEDELWGPLFRKGGQGMEAAGGAQTEKRIKVEKPGRTWQSVETSGRARGADVGGRGHRKTDRRSP
uniref:Uncharacterized protein n=1 Tax=Chromera velia CCMP2878 TaxID=1169474 RepID=A0A0G4HXI6_9ALVE|eukprot:Cvel_33125.t1-p1 / transcript=Cvel_33125.t1 / gene=Cvel_33125 / organism=Chromera_velia_CCMP2878 / gene_product=hypothetical protein / transcript_product=hypothetical protein / location=Cvel_scaffold5301:2024-2566(-) / protein_length=181 / sequence_SO=supercontig / SO=protein_coding / is_pseudo=false